MALAACSEDLTYEMPDNYTDQVQFAVGEVLTGETPTSRAHNHSIDYDPEIHPVNLGVFASFGDEQKVITTEKKQDKTNIWTSDIYWPELPEDGSVDFIGYMYDDGKLTGDAGLAHAGNTYTLTVPVSLSKAVLTAETVDKAPLVCCEPINTDGKRISVDFKMDRTLTGFSVWFLLGEKMDNVRDFIVKEVSVYGSASTSGTVNVVYDMSSNPTTKTVSWTNLSTPAVSFGTEKEPLKLPWKDENKVDKTLLVNSHNTSKYLKWGDEEEGKESSGAFFAIPSADFHPTIKVKYDVVLNDPDNAVITRKDVESTIELNTTNFTHLAAGRAGEITPIKIQIVPSYLYVLADKDQAQGYLVIK